MITFILHLLIGLGTPPQSSAATLFQNSPVCKIVYCPPA
jgi:hypothetical protein